MVIGILGHTLRFGIFALAPLPVLAISVNVVHGICYAFYFATLYIFVDEFFPKDARSSAQGLFNFLILGLGPFVGNFVWPYLEDYFTRDGVVDYRSLFLAPAGTALFAALLLILFFHPPAKATALAGVPDEEDSWEPAGLRERGPAVKDPHIQAKAPDVHGIKE